MPSKPKVDVLLKADRRKQWKLLKAKHATAIKEAKLDFDLKLGPALDKYQAEVDKLAKQTAKGKLTTKQVAPVLKTVPPLETIVNSYHGKLTVLHDPAKKELGALLDAIKVDGESWSDLSKALSDGKTDDAAWSRAQEISVMLDNLREPVATVVARGAHARDYFENDKDESGTPVMASHELAHLASELVEAARLASPALHEVASAAQRVMDSHNLPETQAQANFALFKTRAKALYPLVARLRHASQMFSEAHQRTEIDNDKRDAHALQDQNHAIAYNGEFLERKIHDMLSVD